MGVALSDSLFLRGTVVRRVGSRVFGVEPHAPAPAKDAIVALHQRGERGPRRLVESLHGVRGFGHEAQPKRGHRTSGAAGCLAVVPARSALLVVLAGDWQAALLYFRAVT